MGPVRVQAEICQQTNKRLLDDAFAGFPSGHSSFSCAGLVFLSIWLAAMFQVPLPFLSDDRVSRQVDNHAWTSKHLWRLVLTLTPSAGALFICASRYADFHHAGIDIFAGAVIGTICAITSFRLHYRLFYNGSSRPLWLPRPLMDKTWVDSDVIPTRNHSTTYFRRESDHDLEFAREGTNDSTRPIHLQTFDRNQAH
ncbi:hypothetical protein BDZ85DRAFT_269083 [Elsinoe ampelina]|uniref:Phosphatidic acid phosphatase type 2/haloperoxidase domain-containing protein n=1 Tax=Elsinoe ampelina TaxID=302913 RepID=A0A6A6G0F9_9PEZI|nr:hypothetical protein BDZ85DRAFT_269083 [Elsinoe ampelina]